ncbi:hypothetical protein FNV43_RR05692 [Rhamnella rubrinervis]|uniref:Uncharacterized protein n=1 Tax=Rhamnella rubrinervis TaxID=2594499 RepID=A0A8K0HN38_9ROSA|nr:hypothetical protein FNV43_RR05692 [Rhamnella rubrinervis]
MKSTKVFKALAFKYPAIVDVWVRITNKAALGKVLDYVKKKISTLIEEVNEITPKYLAGQWKKMEESCFGHLFLHFNVKFNAGIDHHHILLYVQILEMNPEDEAEEDGANIDLDSQSKGKCVVLKTFTLQIIFLPRVGLVEPHKLKPGDLVGVNKDSYLILDTLPSEYDFRVKAMEVDEKPTEDNNDIEGLDKQAILVIYSIFDEVDELVDEEMGLAFEYPTTVDAQVCITNKAALGKVLADVKKKMSTLIEEVNEITPEYLHRQRKKMEESYFGHLFLPFNVKFSAGVVHHLLRRQVHTSDKTIMEFNFEGNTAQFRKEEFDLITGLKMGPVPTKSSLFI